jgi:hypothetical protein
MQKFGVLIREKGSSRIKDSKSRNKASINIEPYAISMSYMNFVTEDDYLDITKSIPEKSIDTRDSRKKMGNIL